LTIRSFTTDLKSRELEWSGEGASWRGRRLRRLVSGLLGQKTLETLRLSIEEEADPSGFGLDIPAVLGCDYGDYLRLFQAIDVPNFELPVSSSVVGVEVVVSHLFNVAHTQRSFRFGGEERVHRWEYAAFSQQLLQVQSSRERSNKPPLSYRYLEVLAIPFVVFYPTDFLSLIAPPANDPSLLPSLDHLDVTFFLGDPTADAAALTSIFSLLSPSLRRLSLRVVGPDVHEAQSEDALSALEQFVLLPVSGDEFDRYSFRDAVLLFPPRFRSFVRCVERKLDDFDQDNCSVWYSETVVMRVDRR
jgi:hypothetical protein